MLDRLDRLFAITGVAIFASAAQWFIAVYVQARQAPPIDRENESTA